MSRNGTELRNKTQKKRKSNKKMIVAGIAIFVSLTAIIGLIAVYFTGERYYSSHFAKGTIINNIDVSGMTIDKLNQKISEYTLSIFEKTKEGDIVEELVTGEQVGLELASTNELQKILDGQINGKWIKGASGEYNISYFVELDDTLWKKRRNRLQCFSKDFVEEPKNAHISEYNETEHGYEIIPEEDGNKLDAGKASEVIADAIRQLDKKVNLVDADCYEKPKIKKDNETLTSLVSQLNKYCAIKITYTFDKNVEVLDGNTIHEWLSVNDDNKVILDHDQVANYVATLRKRYDTIFRSRKFTTSYGKKITIEGGDYGWWMNYGQETKELTAMLEAGESGERTPVYFQKAASYGEHDYGDTYIEVNLTAQHMFYYEKGKLKLESDFVSGNVTKGHETPAGVYGITYMQRNATLVGEGYETPVSYWMPFNGHIGLHDATWRATFGGSVYKANGSHGCVNLPYAVAKELYGMVTAGTPVICYNLSRTESKETTHQSKKEIAQSVIDRINEIGTVTKNSEKAIERARILYNEINVNARKEVLNYKVLLDAEKEYKELTKQ